jgi:GNAT superfamily N-acetyltransferase
LPDEEMADFIAVQQAGYIDELIAAGKRPDDARRIVTAQAEQLFPEGRPAAGHVVYRVLDDHGQPAGALWIGPAELGQNHTYWVFKIEIDPSHRGTGLGRAAMILAEQVARGGGAVELGLSVFAHNTVAHHLYQSIGYQTTALTMRKPL